MGCALVGLVLSLNYPLLPPWAALFFMLLVAAFYTWPTGWLLAVPALLPLLAFAPWSGWLTFEEMDLLILAVAAAGYAQLFFNRPSPAAWHGVVLSAPARTVLALFFASLLLALLRGFADAGGFSFGWFQGYHEPLNSLRLAKSAFEALLLLPLWQAAYQQNPKRSQDLLSLGLMLGLSGAALTTVWERVAFTGLLNFSSDYRTTGLFWEMHVGGAALDGFLALTVPFALREVVLARTPARWGLSAAVLTLAAYACLTTFSRGVYLAIPVGVVVFLGLNHGQRKRLTPATASRFEDRVEESHWAALLIAVAGFAIGATWIFQSSGYRGMAALLGTVMLMLPLARVLRGYQRRQWLLGAVLSAVLVLLVGAIAWRVPKGAYVAWGLSVVLMALMLLVLRQKRRPSDWVASMALASFSATVAGTVLVAEHWGDAVGLRHAAPVLAVVLVVGLTAGVRRQPLWPDALRWQASAGGVMTLAAAVIGIFGGGTYMSERFASGGQDLGGRLTHWQLGRDLLNSPADWLLGKGMGRFPANYFLLGDPLQRPGDYRLHHDAVDHYLTLTGGLHLNGWGELFRLTQRVSAPGASARVTARVRSDKNVSLYFEVCEKHLLYAQGCLIKPVSLPGAPGVWQSVQLELQGDGASRGDWYAPKLLAFSVAVESRGGMVDLTHLTLTSAAGQPLLSNGDFSDNMAHWFFTSDRSHLPWHIKNLFMNLLFDQGVVGAALWGLLLLGALWRTSLGRARQHPLAPALAASLLGFSVVGLFDSLLDVPRLGFLFYWLLLLALTLRGPTRTLETARSASRPLLPLPPD